MKSEQDSITRNTLITLFNSYDKDISSEETISSFEEEKKCVQGCLQNDTIEFCSSWLAFEETKRGI